MSCVFLIKKRKILPFAGRRTSCEHNKHSVISSPRGAVTVKCLHCIYVTNRHGAKLVLIWSSVGPLYAIHMLLHVFVCVCLFVVGMSLAGWRGVGLYWYIGVSWMWLPHRRWSQPAWRKQQREKQHKTQSNGGNAQQKEKAHTLCLKRVCGNASLPITSQAFTHTHTL